jgi:DNA primase
MKLEGQTFPEALEHLARRCGVEIRKRIGEKAGEQSGEKQRILEINHAAKTYFERRLWEGSSGIDYIKKRGLREDLIKEFELGFAINLWNGLLSHLRQLFPIQLLLKAGLICARQNGTGYYDRFRNRVIFPIHNFYGDICGFGGRLIEPGEESPKYLNSPETPVYSKGQVLYGFYQAKNAIRHKKQAIVVEGYLDLLTLYQAGFTNVVATLGTALTVNHVRILKRYASDVVLVFDSDPAGVKAALRGIELSLDQGISAKIGILPLGKDPDGLFNEEGKEKFAEVIEGAQSFIDYLLNSDGVADREVIVQKKAQKIDQIIFYLSKIGNPLERDGYIPYIAQKVGISEEAIRERLRQTMMPRKKGYVRPFFRPDEFGLSIHEGLLERFFIKLALELSTPSEAVLQNVDESEFKDPELRDLAGLILNYWRQGIPVEPRRLLLGLDTERKKELVSEVIVGTEISENPEQALMDCINKLHQAKICEQLRGIKEKLDSEALSKEEEDLLLNEYCRLKKNACALNLF